LNRAYYVLGVYVMKKQKKHNAFLNTTSLAGRTAVRILSAMGLAVLVLLVVMPMILTLTNSFMSEQEIHYSYSQQRTAAQNASGRSAGVYHGIKLIPDVVTINQYYSVLIQKTQYHFLFWNSIRVVAPIVAGQIMVASMAAFAFSKIPFRGREPLFFAYIIVMMMPFQVTLVPNYIVASYLGLLDNTLSIILPGIFNAFGVFLLRQSMVLIPDAYCESAYVDGANRFYIFLKVVLPMSKAGIASLAILVFIDNWNMIEQPLIFLQDNTKSMLSVFLSTINTNERGIAFAASSIYMTPMLLVFLYGESYLVEGIQLSGLKA